MRSILLTKIAVLLAALFSYSCAHTAPDLPPDYGSENSSIHLDESKFEKADLALGCQQIKEELTELRNQKAAIKSQIVASRESDQSIGYFSSVIFPPLWLAIDNDDDFKALLDRVQERIDTLISLSRLKYCRKSQRRIEVSSDFEQELKELVELRENGVVSPSEYLELRSRIFDKYYPEN